MASPDIIGVTKMDAARGALGALLDAYNAAYDALAARLGAPTVPRVVDCREAAWIRIDFHGALLIVGGPDRATVRAAIEQLARSPVLKDPLPAGSWFEDVDAACPDTLALDGLHLLQVHETAEGTSLLVVDPAREITPATLGE